MREIDRKKPVAVTGATGYVAGWIVKRLLEDGIDVHAAVRDPDNAGKLKYLNAIAEKAPGAIKYFKADLLNDGSYDEVMQGCELVFHTASPFKNQVDDPQKELIDPALKGTINVLNSANKTESLKRVVLTSSIAAVLSDAKDLEDTPYGVFNEDVWNTKSSIDHSPYFYSKTLAEREAWKMAQAQDRWDMVVVNPAMVIGPGLNPKGTSESFNIVRQIGDGTMKMGAPELYFDVADVRDVAEAHYQAGFTPGAKGRHIISAGNTSILELAVMLRNKYGEAYPFPKRKLPKFLLWLMAPMVGFTRKVISRNVGYPWNVDNSKSKKELGLQYRPIQISIADFFQQMIDNKIVKSSTNQ